MKAAERTICGSFWTISHYSMYTDNIGMYFVSETSQQSFTPLVLGIAGTGDGHILLCTIIIILIII